MGLATALFSVKGWGGVSSLASKRMQGVSWMVFLSQAATVLMVEVSTVITVVRQL